MTEPSLMEAVDPAAIREYVNRDWRPIEKAKAEHWAAWKKGKSAAEILHVGEELHAQAARMKPDRPAKAERDADLAAHVRLSELLRRAAEFTCR